MATSHNKRSSKGSALLMVLWLTAALSAVGLAVANNVRAETERTETNVDDARSYFVARGAIERAALHILWGRQYFTDDGLPIYYVTGSPSMDLAFPSADVHVDVIPENSKLSLNGSRPEDILRFMDAATTSAHRAAALTHRLLAFARRQSLDTRPNDINRLVAGMEDLLHRTLGEQIELRSALATELWTAFVDANQLENAILNLAINARDAMIDGGTLTIATANTALNETYTSQHEGLEPGDYVAIRVSDTGVGMPADVLAKAVDPFFTTKPAGMGTGLGLSMIYGFARQSRGHLRMESRVGHGTIVELYLPRALQDAIDLSVPTVATPRGQGEAILVVEDDATVRLIINDVLEELGYKVLLASDARTAIPMLQSDQTIDLLVSDVVLPHVNGQKLAEIARVARPALKVLFVSGYAENAILREDFLGPGMDMLTKPFDLDALGAKVRLLLEQKLIR